ncbi:MAG: hypothetical protein ACREQ5_07630 [Candidatus Dormibacteria bacterium]
MPVRSNPADATKKWVQNIGQATDRITRGVQAVSVAPGQKAAAQSAKWLQRVTASQDKWRTRVASVSLSDWQNAMINVGIPRVAQGAQAKQAKMQDFMTSFLPYLATGVARIDAMPSVTLEDSINKAVAMIRHNAAFKRNSSG